MAKLNFDTNAAPGTSRTMKATPAKFRESKGRPNISQSDGIRPAFPLMPYGHLPVSFTDETTRDDVVIPKGRIVSAITQNSQDLGDGDTYYNVGKGIMGLMVPCNGGDPRGITSPVDNQGKTIVGNLPIGIVEHDVYQDINGDNLNYDMRNKNWGVLSQQLIKIPAVDTYAFDDFYEKVGLFVATAAGGAETKEEDVPGAIAQETIAFTSGNATTTLFNAATGYLTGSYDITAITVGGFIQDATVIANSSMADSGVVTIAAAEGCDNAAGTTQASCEALDPAGTWGVLTNASYVVDVSYTYDFDNEGTGAPAAAVTAGGYFTCEKKYSFLTYNSEAGEGDSGMGVQSDFYGNYKADADYAAGAAENKSVQTVGTLLGVDYRFGKDLLDTVQSKWEDDAAYATAGTRTKGVPQFLYDFAYAALEGALLQDATDWATKWPNNDPASVIKDAVDAGVFGEAWIQVNV